MSKARWIKLYSKIMDSAVWSDPVRLKAWIYILLNANYKDKEWFKNGQVVKVKRGQFVTSVRKLAIAWGCSKDTTRRILKQLQDLHMIRYESATLRYTLITVIKYEVFQDGKGVMCDSDEYTDNDSDKYSDKDSDKDTDKDTDTTQHKNIKNNKKVKNKEEPAHPPDGGADPYGEPPAGWDDEWEKDFMNEIYQNHGTTRAEWYDFWHVDEEGGTK